MTRDDSQSCLAFSEEHCWHSSLLSHALLGTIQSEQTELSPTLKLSLRPSFTRIQLHVYILELLHSHFIKQQLRLDSKRNRRRRRLETKRVEIFNKHCLFAPSVKRYSRNRIASKYHYHASAYSLHKYKLMLPFYLFRRRKRKRCRHGQLEQTARMSGKSYDRRSSTANQRNSSGRFRGHPT